MGKLIVLKLREGIRCQGCGAIHRLVSKDSHLCLFCLGLKLDVDAQKKKIAENLDETLRRHFAGLGQQIISQLAEFTPKQ